MKDSAFRDFTALAYIETVKYKNNFKEALRHPLTAIKAIGAFLFPFLLVLLVYTRKNGGASIMLKAVIKPHLLSAAVMALLLIVFMLSVYHSVSKYNPSQFSCADVNYLFPSPISPRTIYAWTIIRKCISDLIGTILIVTVMAIAISKVSDINMFRLIYVILALLFLPVLFNALLFLIYTLSNKFNIGQLVKYCVLGFGGIIAVYLFYNIIGCKNILAALVSKLNGSFFSDIPIIGWLRDMLISPLLTDKSPLAQTIKLVIVTAAALFAAIYFADDYYEEAGSAAFNHQKIVDAAATSNVYDIADNLEKSDENKPAKTFNLKEFTGPWAFIWKSSIINKRTAKKGPLIGYAITIIASLVMCYFLRGKEFNSFYPLFILIFLQGAVSSSQLSSPLKYEIKKQYIFLLPGSAVEKLLALHIKPILNNVITDTIMLVTLMIFVKTSILQALLLWLIAAAGIIVCYFSVIIIVLIMPPEDNGKNSIISTLISYIMLAPSIAACALIAIYFKNVMLALSIFVIISIVAIMVILLLSDFLFNKIELK